MVVICRNPKKSISPEPTLASTSEPAKGVSSLCRSVVVDSNE